MGILAAKLSRRKMTSEELDQIIKTVVERILKMANPDLIYLFGSAVEDTMTYASDFDFTIIFSDQKNLKVEKKNIYTANLFPDLMVDLLFFSFKDFKEKSQVGGICFEIAQKGRIVYDKRTKV